MVITPAVVLWLAVGIMLSLTSMIGPLKAVNETTRTFQDIRVTLEMITFTLNIEISKFDFV